MGVRGGGWRGYADEAPPALPLPVLPLYAHGDVDVVTKAASAHALSPELRAYFEKGLVAAAFASGSGSAPNQPHARL